jgi:hypothetical protein
MSNEAGPFEVLRKSHCAEAIRLSDVTEGVMCQAVASSAPNCSATYASALVSGKQPASPHSKKNRKVVSLFNYTSDDDSNDLENDSLEATDSDLLEIPARQYDCEHYDTCLSLAAALDWKSFSCSGCNGCVNQQLLWRANHALRKNSALKRICNLPLAV